MKLRYTQCDVTPSFKVMQGGYGTRTHEFEDVHDPIIVTIFEFFVENKSVYWMSADISNGTNPIIDGIIRKLKNKGIELEKSNLIFGGSHTHSGPNIYVDKEPEVASIQYYEYFTEKVAQEIVDLKQKDFICVTTKYSRVLIDGLYSNRNTKNKAGDKYIHFIGFFERDKLVAMHVTMSHHCTILGPKNYCISADLFGSIRDKLQKVYGAVVLMAQGNAADMGNRQYRRASNFEELHRQASEIVTQIIEKLSWEEVNMEAYSYHRYILEEKYILNTEKYENKVREAEKKLSKATTEEESKILFSMVRGYKRKIAIGDAEQTVMMPVEVIDMNDVQIVVIPGELGSTLGLKIKEASPRKKCILWGYANGANLGYMVESKAYEEESFESHISIYPENVGEDYTNFVIKHLHT